MTDVIRLRGVRVHNLKNIDLDIPINSLTVITGPSGSGKSSLAFDTLYAEGRRRFVQSLSAYARQFLEKIERPDADVIESIFPAIAIQQKNQITGSRSTVGTITEVYDYLRLLFGRIGIVRDPETGEIVRNHTIEDVIAAVEKTEEGKKIWVCFFPDKKVEANVLLKKGFVRVLKSQTNPVEMSLESLKSAVGPQKAVVVDRLKAGPDIRNRIAEASETAFTEGLGKMSLLVEDAWLHFDTAFRSSSGKKFIKPEPRLFSFNNPFGACPRCRGFGDIIDLNEQAIIPDPGRTIEEGVIEPWRRATRQGEQNKLYRFCEQEGIPTDIPWNDLTEEHREMIYQGKSRFGGVRGFFKRLEKKTYKMHIRVFLSRYRGYFRCPECHGSRIRSEAGLVRVGKKSIRHIVEMPIHRSFEWLDSLKLTSHQAKIVERVMEELNARLGLLDRLGIGYLSMNRRAQTLSGGEVQRINLATALGGGLIGTLFVLDEPTIGLHERDTERLITILQSIRDLGNTVLVVEHDKKVMECADYIVDLGPYAGEHGGNIMFAGNYESFLKSKESTTAKFLRGERTIAVTSVRRKKTSSVIQISGAREHNLKNINVEIPLNMLCCVTGVSGSGKSTLVQDVLYTNIMSTRGQWQKKVGECDQVSGFEQLKKIEMVDQGAIGRTPRSNPATYIKAFAEIRAIFAERFQAKVRGYKPSTFSFNLKGGRCETCQGTGEIAIEMQFMPDVHILCEDCNGTRFKKEVRDIKYKGLNIHQVLQLSVNEAIEYFRDYPSLIRKLNGLEEVGLGYLRLGQSATTMSGGEAQRIKLAYHMSRTDVTGSLFIFDEPTTGLHFTDIKKLLEALKRLVFHGASVLVIEHNLDIIKNADWIIDLGPEGGDKGGWVIATGTPEVVAARDGSFTGTYLREVL